MTNTRTGLDTKHFEPITALSADVAQVPDNPLSRSGTGKEQWIGNPQDAELGRPPSAESADLEGFVRETYAAALSGRNVIVALRELAQKSANHARQNCCGDAHQELTWALDWIKQLGFVKERQEKNGIVEELWVNKRAEEAEQQVKDYADMWDQAHLALTVAGVQGSEDGVLLSLETRIDKLRKERDKYKQIVILRSGQRKSTT